MFDKLTKGEKIEKTIIIFALVYLFFHLISFFYLAFLGAELQFEVIAPFHFTGMGLNLIAFILTIRNLYLRTFPNPNSKLTWLLLILCTSGIGWYVYIFKHAVKPRTSQNPK